MKIHFEPSGMPYNEEAMAEISAISKHHAEAKYNQMDMDKSKYHAQEERELEAVIKKYAKKVAVSKEYENGLKQYCLLDEKDRIVSVAVRAEPPCL